jgi:putative ATP-binding cassette transporter
VKDVRIMNEASATDGTSVLRPFFVLSRGFWSGATATRAWLLTALVIGCVFAQLATQVAMNTWNRVFFDALERRDGSGVFATVWWLTLIIIAMALVLSTLIVTRMTLQMRWREGLTQRMAGWWIADQRYYRLSFVAPDQSAPEFRISDDARLSVEPLVEFGRGLLGAFAMAITFAAILWSVAGSARVTLGGVTIEIPAFMAVAAVLYAAVASGLAYLAGRPLVMRVSSKGTRSDNGYGSVWIRGLIV